MNYKAIIKPYVWFIDKEDRVWVITSLCYGWEISSQKFNEDAYLVNLLQVKSEEPIARPWDEIVSLIERGLMRVLI